MKTRQEIYESTEEYIAKCIDTKIDWTEEDDLFFSEKFYSEEEIIKALDILPCEELKDECLERLGIIRGLEE